VTPNSNGCTLSTLSESPRCLCSLRKSKSPNRRSRKQNLMKPSV